MRDHNHGERPLGERHIVREGLMLLMKFGGIMAALLLLAAMAGAMSGCATTGGNTYSDSDAKAVQEMEWNLDPWR